MRAVVRTAIVLAAGVPAAAGLGIGSAGAAGDVARLGAVSVSAKTLHPGDVVTIDAAARDKGSNEYTVTFISLTTKVDLVAETCSGTTVGSPSPDTPACEYGNATTTTRTTTHTTGEFRVAADASGTFDVTVCAASMSNPPVPFPAGGSCQTRTFRIA
jgi:hypothetical protein